MSNQAGLGLGSKVHSEEINEYPEDLKQEYLRLSVWVKAVASFYGRSIVIRIIDPQSFVGLWKLIRYRIRRYPTMILEQNTIFSGWNMESQLHIEIQKLLKDRSLPIPEQTFSLENHYSLKSPL